MEYRQDITGLPSTNAIRNIFFRPFFNLKVRCRLANGDNQFHAQKVVEAASLSDAEASFALFDLLAEVEGPSVTLTEMRRSDNLQHAVIDIDVPLAANAANVTLVGQAIDFQTNVALDGLSAKCEAGTITVGGGIAFSSIVLNAGDAKLLGHCGGGHHFVEVEAGSTQVKLSAQDNLIWRIATSLGAVRDRRTNTIHESPYTGQVGSGAARLFCTLGVGDVEVL